MKKIILYALCIALSTHSVMQPVPGKLNQFYKDNTKAIAIGGAVAALGTIWGLVKLKENRKARKANEAKRKAEADALEAAKLKAKEPAIAKGLPGKPLLHSYAVLLSRHSAKQGYPLIDRELDEDTDAHYYPLQPLSPQHFSHLYSYLSPRLDVPATWVKKETTERSDYFPYHRNRSIFLQIERVADGTATFNYGGVWYYRLRKDATRMALFHPIETEINKK